MKNSVDDTKGGSWGQSNSHLAVLPPNRRSGFDTERRMPKGGLEPPRPQWTLEPESSASTNSAISAGLFFNNARDGHLEPTEFVAKNVVARRSRIARFGPQRSRVAVRQVSIPHCDLPVFRTRQEPARTPACVFCVAGLSRFRIAFWSCSDRQVAVNVTSRHPSSVLGPQYGGYISEPNGAGFGRCPTPKTASFRPNP